MIQLIDYESCPVEYAGCAVCGTEHAKGDHAHVIEIRTPACHMQLCPEHFKELIELIIDALKE